MVTRAPSAHTHDRLLHAAIEVVRQHGAHALTLDAVAAEAGVSKGGLLYHFPNKDALLRGMIEDYLRKCQQQIDIELSHEPEARPGRWLRAYIRARFSEEAVARDMVMAFNVAIGTDPALMQLILDDASTLLRQALNDGLEATQALLIYMAVEGFYQTNMISGIGIDMTQADRLCARLLDMTETA